MYPYSVPFWDLFLGLSHQEDEAAEVDQELQHHCQDGVDIEDVGQGTLVR